MKSIVLPGDKTEAPCETCGRFVSATWGYHPDSIEDGTVVEDVMQAQCDTCGDLLATAGQSTHAIRQAMEDRAHRRAKLRLPRPLRDFIGLQLSIAGADPTQHELFMRAVFAEALKEGAVAVTGIVRGLSDPVLDLPSDTAINVALSSHVEDMLGEVISKTGLQRSEVLRRLIVMADGDLRKRVQAQLKTMAMVCA